MDELFSDSFLVVGQLVDGVLRNGLQVSTKRSSGDEGGSTCDYTPTLKSVRAQNIMCMVKYIAKMLVEILPVGVCLFISVHGLGFLTLVFPGINVSFHSNFL